MKKSGKKLVALLFALLLVVLSVPFSSNRVEAASSIVPTLYCNDEVWYKDSNLPLVRYYSSYLVPVSIFEMFDGFEVVVDRREGEFMVTNWYNDSYITFNYKDSYALTDKGEEFYFVSHRMYSSEYYVSAETVCEYFGLNCEIYTSPYDGSLCLRISDDSATQTLEQLLLYYNPAALGVDTGHTGANIEPYAKGKKVYFTFEGISDSYTDRILNTLRRYGVKATFFLSEEDIANDPATVIRIYSEGHSIGIYVKTKTEGTVLDFDDMMGQLGRANQRLSQLLKIRTRLVRTDLSMADTTRIFAGVHYENLKYCGYVLWNYGSSTYTYNHTMESIGQDIMQTVMNETIPVIQIPSTDLCITAFSSVMEELSAKENYTFLAIDPSVQEYNYIENIR
ncbi:MAG: polysaccharide deacetylase family protein [Clostridia bacterium]|nr:polysaccharide deacetylase family protein [Clostridia bacterium]